MRRLVRAVLKAALILFLAAAFIVLGAYGGKLYYDHTKLPTPTPALSPTPTPKPTPPPAPDLSRVLPLINAEGMAHGCPIAPGIVITNAHVVLGSDRKPPMNPYLFSTPGGRVGIFLPHMRTTYADLASGVLSFDVDPYPVAAGPPLPGEWVYWRSFDWRKAKDILAPWDRAALVSRVVAGHIVVYGDRIVEGASGGCILNQRGEAVGVVAWRIHVEEESDYAGLGPGIWGDRVHPLLNDINTTLTNLRNQPW